LQAVDLPRLDDGNGEPLPRDLPDELCKTSTLAKRIRKLMRDAAWDAKNSIRNSATIRRIRKMRAEAERLEHMRMEKLSDI